MAVTDAVSGVCARYSAFPRVAPGGIPHGASCLDGRSPSILAGDFTSLSGDEGDGDSRSAAEPHSRAPSVGYTAVGRWVAPCRQSRPFVPSCGRQISMHSIGNLYSRAGSELGSTGVNKCVWDVGWGSITTLRGHHTNSCPGLAIGGLGSPRICRGCRRYSGVYAASPRASSTMSRTCSRVYIPVQPGVSMLNRSAGELSE